MRVCISALFLQCFFLYALALRGHAQVFQHISEHDGAPKNDIMGITQDKRGFMWYATSYGLFRYDSRKFKPYRHDPQEKRSISSDFLSTVFCDSRGTLWAGGWNGLNRYDASTDSFTRFTNTAKDRNSISSDTIYCIMQDRQKRVWVGTSAGLNCIETRDGKTWFTRYLQAGAGKQGVRVQMIVEGEKNELWLATDDGLMQFQAGRAHVLRANADPRIPDINDFASISRDQNDNIWLGLKSGGLVKFHAASKQFEFIDSFRSKNGDWPIVSAFVANGDQRLWVATQEGLADFNTQTHKADWYIHNPANALSLGDDVILSMFKDRLGGLWLGNYNTGIDYLQTEFQLFSRAPFFIDGYGKSKFLWAWLGITPKQKIWLISPDRHHIQFFDRATGKIFEYEIDLDVAKVANHFYVDADDVIWFGADATLSSYNIKTRKRQDYRFPNPRDTPEGRGRIYRILEDSRGRIWLCGSFGLLSFDRRTASFDEPGIEDFAISLFEDSRHNLWCGGKNKVWLISNNSGKPEQIKLNSKTGSNGAGLDDIWRISEDRSGRIWLVCNEGLKLYDKKHRQFSPHTVKGNPGLAYLVDIQSDKNGYLWLSRENELVRYHPDLGDIQHYGYQEGLPKNGRLAVNSAVKDDQGVLYYNTSREMFSFNPSQVVTNKRPSPIAITSLRLFNKEVNAGDENGILKEEISRQKELIFRHDQDIFTLHFALLSFSSSHKNKYRFRLSGFEQDWNDVDVPSATYTNLPAGRYTFQVKAANGDGFWNPEPLNLTITVLPPWWQTWYAYLAYFLLAALVAYGIFRFFWIRKSLQKENELYQSKLDFFTGISHEIRTHLSLISGPIEKASQVSGNVSEMNGYLAHAKTNSDRLLRLVNELLDFRRIQSRNVTLNVSQQDINAILGNVVMAYEHLALEKGINLQLVTPEDPVKLWLDPDQIQKVFFNLLGNAFKFTPDQGKIIVTVSENSREVIVEVLDTGIGIPQQFLPRLFNNFFQVSHDNSGNTGYGIGLALAKGIVDLHRGSLTVHSRPRTDSSEGETNFTVHLPKEQKHLEHRQASSEPFQAPSPIVPLPVQAIATMQEANPALPARYRVLLIEDNQELRVFTKKVFENTFDIMEAENGEVGLEVGRTHLPDLILCDIMMPVMDGLAVCRQIKSDPLTSHIPLILLTAKSSVLTMIEGLELGADDYLVKPFDLKILELKIINLIRVRTLLKQPNDVAVSLEPDNLVLSDVDGEFIIKLKNLVVENLADPGFGVNQMAHELGLSVSVLYRKLRSLTDMTVNDFVKAIRMKRAFQLLESGAYHVNEVATAVGFEDKKHFSKEFRKVYGKNPIDVRRQSPE